MDQPLLPHSRHTPHLSPAAVAMLTVGGTIGTGLFFSVANLLQNGPLLTLASMLYIAFIVTIVLEVVTELSVLLPGNGSICAFQFFFIGRSVGMANSVIYWLSWGLTFALELSIFVSICSFWSPALAANHSSLMIFLLWLCLTGFNLLPVDVYGQIELWLASIKIVAIVAWMAIVFVCLLDKSEFFYVWLDDWPASFIGDAVSWGSMGSRLCQSIVFSSFIFQSVESLAITTGDIENPQKTLPRVSKAILVRIVVFYLLSVFLLTVSVPFSDPHLADPNISNVLSSPFLVALINCGFTASGPLLSVANVVILSAIVSAANSNVYFGSRYLMTMVECHGTAPGFKFLAKKSSRGVPYNAVLATAMWGLLALLLRFSSVAQLFAFLLNCCASAGILMWCLACWSYVRFRKAMDLQKVDVSRMFYRSAWRLDWWAKFAFLNMAAVLCLNGVGTLGLSAEALLHTLGVYSTVIGFLALWVYFEITGDGLVNLYDIDLEGRANLR